MTALWAEGGGIALTGDEHKVSVTVLPFCVIWHDRHSADWLAALASPYPAAPDCPHEVGARWWRQPPKGGSPSPAGRLSRFYHKRAPSINVRRPPQPSAAKPLSNLRTLGAIAPSNFITLKPHRGLSIRRVNLREYWKAPPRSRSRSRPRLPLCFFPQKLLH